ncbi:MAG: murE1 [Clostridia bacterium]|nr:murE1 [Clostridia bacterium]
MLLDNFERFGVTADSRKVLPGMAFVDLSENKNRKEIYNAYDNGAAIIFTAQNISDPELPVIKVNNVYETMLILLNKYFDSPQNRVRLIAVSGSNDKAIALDLLYKLLRDKDSEDLGKGADFEELVKSVNSLTIEDMYEYLNKFASSGSHLTPMIVDYKMKYFKFINSFSFDCALITGVDSFDIADRNYVLGSIRSFLSQIQDGRPIIVNIDDDLVLKALEGSKNNIVITYGLNKKAAVTATSIDINERTSFNYCLQRSMTSSNGNVLEPFEMPVTVNMLGSRCIHNALAAITCALYYDVDMERIKQTLEKYSSPERRFEISAINGISILDNYCSSPGDLDKAFEGIQMLSFSRLFVIQSINKAVSWEELKGYIKVYNQWYDLLGISEVVFTGCVDADSEIEPLSLHDIRVIKKELKDHIKIKYIESLSEAAQYTAAAAKAGTLVVLAGDDCMSSAKEQLGKAMGTTKFIH